MKESTRTIAFLGAAVVSVGLAFAFKPSTPKAPSEFAEVGGAFYPEFDALQAKSLKVVSFNESTATSKTFEVEFKEGLWRIPSHHNYPADAKDRLAKTAASVVAIRKDEFRSSSNEDHEELGVIDPLESDATKLKGRGQRLTLKDEQGKVLADYIIGKQVKNRSGFYYVRNPEQKTVYVSKLNVDLSTKFSDWIETNLLNLGTGQLREIAINKYSIDQEKGTITDTDVSELSREKSGDPWKLKGLSDDKEELNTSDINTMISTLEDLRIVGVRPKPAALSRDLKQDEGIKIDTPTMVDLQSRGFYFARGGQLVSQEGEVLATTDNGVTYVLRFGEVFAGTESEAETGIGSSKPEEEGKESEKQAGETEKQAEKAEGTDGKSEEKKTSLTENRYVFISAAFDESKLGAKPEKPTAPPEPPKDEKKPEETKPDGEKKEGAEGEQKPAEGPAAPDKPAEPNYEDLKQKYDADLAKYETDLADFDKRKKEGEERAGELNRRFADWFYVISSESFNKLRLSRSALVKEKTAAAPSAQTPGTPPSVTPENPVPVNPAPANPAGEKPADEKPATEPPVEEPKGEEPKAEEPKPEEPKPEEKPADEKPAAEGAGEEKPPETKPEEKPATETTPPAEEKK